MAKNTATTIITVPAYPDAPFDPPVEEWYAAWDPSPDHEGGPWGVYDAECDECGMAIMHVAAIEDVNSGAVVVDGPQLCQFCESPMSLN